MNINVFIEELRARFLPLGKLNVATTSYRFGNSTPLVDSIWFIEAQPAEIEVHIRDFQKQKPVVVADVHSQLSLNYVLGTETSDVMRSAEQEYKGLPNVLEGIRQYAALISEAYKVALAYDLASVLYNQFMSTNNPDTLRQAYSALNGLSLNDGGCISLFDAIKEAARSRGIIL